MRFLLVILVFVSFSFAEYVERVIDGDTIVIGDKKRKKSKIRLYGIDAPEKTQKGGKESKRYLEKRIKHKNVKIKGNKKDRYKRTIAIVELNGKDINKEMVESGNAHAYKKYSKKYLSSETKARKAKRGIWKDKDVTTPENFRKINKKRKKKNAKRTNRSTSD